MLVPAFDNPSRTDDYLGLIDGLILTGGFFDIDPALYGEKPIKEMGPLKRARTNMEMRITRKALKLSMPILGICGGHQLINVVFGGTLYQDLQTQMGRRRLKHEQSRPSNRAVHRVQIAKGSRLHGLMGQREIKVNSTHHQAIKDVGKGLLVCARTGDGVIEAVESADDGPFLVGVQWHPELLLENDSPSRRLFAGFMRECRLRKIGSSRGNAR